MDDLARPLVRRMTWTAGRPADPLLTREWLVTNGLGGYASGSVAGVSTRRYHGLLIAALPAPYARTIMLSHLAETLHLPGGALVELGGEERAGRPPSLPGVGHLIEFRLEAGLPVWRYRLAGDAAVEKRVFLPHQQNTVYVTYRLDGDAGGPVRVELRPSVQFRGHDAPVSTDLGGPFVLHATDGRYELHALHRPGLPPLRMTLHGQRPAFTVEGARVPEVLYRVEESRGYDYRGDLWSPGYFRALLAPGADVTLVASTEPWETVSALAPADALAAERDRRDRLLENAEPRARGGVAAELVLAADQFIVTPAGRAEEAARAHASGDEVRTVIAGYHWFTDWGRDTMISLEGLTLATGRTLEAGYILRTFAHYVRDGLIPNMFPEGEKEGLYHTADATLWFFHAVDRYVARSGDGGTLERLLPTLTEIIAAHRRGTRFGIAVDPRDGLLRQGADGYQLTWMDAKCDGWVVTPRRGKAVEINALWYNALRLVADWIGDAPLGRELAGEAERVARSFNERFFYAEGGHLYDVVDGEHGDDPACRPNQLLALSLRHPVLDPARWRSVVDVVEAQLLTPVGLRSLAPGHPDYKPTYHGDLRTRDAAYHQGTVWAWLIGPFVDAWVRAYPDRRADARRFCAGLASHLDEACIGSVSEIFDAEPPFTPRGCVAQAWSVAELLRAWIETA